MYFRQARSSPTGYLYARCSLSSGSSDPALFTASSLTEEVRLAVFSVYADFLERLQDVPLKAISRLPIR